VRVIDGRVRTKQVPHIIDGFEATDQITLSEDGLVYLRLRPDLDYETVKATGKPTRVGIGAVKGFSLPIWNAEANVNEQLFYYASVPRRWDEASNFKAHIDCYLATANTDKKFNMELGWIQHTPGDVISTAVNTVSVETDTGEAAQYKSFTLEFDIDYDISPSDPIQTSDIASFRVRRIDASTVEAEVSGGVVIVSTDISFRRDKLGAITP